MRPADDRGSRHHGAGPGFHEAAGHGIRVLTRVEGQVVPGLGVVAGTARLLPVSSQVDRCIGRSLPHLHVEITGP